MDLQMALRSISAMPITSSRPIPVGITHCSYHKDLKLKWKLQRHNDDDDDDCYYQAIRECVLQFPNCDCRIHASTHYNVSVYNSNNGIYLPTANSMVYINTVLIYSRRANSIANSKAIKTNN